MEWLWDQLTRIYGPLFIKKWGVSDSETGGTWLENLSDLTPIALKSGLERMKKTAAKTGEFSEFPPNSIQFRALCLAFYEDLKLPSIKNAYQEIKNSAYSTRPHFSHQVIRLIATKLPVDFWERESEQETFTLFKKAYEQVCDLIKQGHELPEAKGLVKMPKPASKEVANHYLQQMKLKLGALL
ncbi:MAG: hypothetical protein H0U57_06070 [Tatlockia sp.]|nr:hypothetical protein [Tatlockia sp.]